MILNQPNHSSWIKSESDITQSNVNSESDKHNIGNMENMKTVIHKSCLKEDKMIHMDVKK